MFNSWIYRGAELRKEFENGDPFPLLIIDDFLRETDAERVLAEFPTPEAMPKSRDYLFGDKHELSSVAERGPACSDLYRGLLGTEFQQFLADLTGRDLFVDPSFHGGGFHQSGDGGYLDMHVDFNVHPLHDNWLRTLNILLYLNKDWKPEYDGRLLVKAGRDGAPRAIEPWFNRGVLMLTDDNTWHGFRKMSLPPGVTRKSIAAYAYQLVDSKTVVAHTTGWAPEGGGVLKRALARHYNTAVRLKNKLMGSGTAKNR